MRWKSLKVSRNGPRSQKKPTIVTHPAFQTLCVASGRPSCSVLTGNRNCRGRNVHIELGEEYFVSATRCNTFDDTVFAVLWYREEHQCVTNSLYLKTFIESFHKLLTKNALCPISGLVSGIFGATYLSIQVSLSTSITKILNCAVLL